jgi:hypothetical protein
VSGQVRGHYAGAVARSGTGSSSKGSTFGSPLQKIGMGLLIVFLTAAFPAHPSPTWQHYDALPDPVGWAFVYAGTVALTRDAPAFGATRWLAAVAGVVSVPVWFPQLTHRLDASGQWFTSLPQIVFCLWLAREVGIQGARQQPRDVYAAKRFGLLVYGFAVVAVLPVLTFGGGMDQLVSTTVLVSTVVDLALVYFLFRVHRREWLGGPGPLLIHPRSG